MFHNFPEAGYSKQSRLAIFSFDGQQIFDFCVCAAQKNAVGDAAGGKGPLNYRARQWASSAE